MLMVSIMLVGCGSKERMYAHDFQREMENKGFTVIDQTATAMDNNFLQVLEAIDAEEKFSFEFYFMKGDEAANAVYEYAKSNLEANYATDETVVRLGRSNDNYADYSLSASDYYSRIIRIENTVLYVTAHAEYLEEAKQIIKEFGY